MTEKRQPALARLLGSSTSGILELLLFHPVDTMAKRLMSNRSQIFIAGHPTAANLSRLSTVIFTPKNASSSIARKYISLFPGLGFAAGYKVLQRIYKFGGQPFVVDYLRKSDIAIFRDKNGKALVHAVAGSLIGIGEIILLPLDVLKIKQQTNPNALKGRGVLEIFRSQGRELYRGAGWTALRNAPGSFALFGGSALVKEHVFKLPDYNKATFLQNFAASVAGAVASITVAAPLDVVKTRIQNRNFGDGKSGLRIIAEIVKEEGMHGFFKGITPKVLVVGPKLVFGFTVAQQLIPWFTDALEKK